MLHPASVPPRRWAPPQGRTQSRQLLVANAFGCSWGRLGAASSKLRLGAGSLRPPPRRSAGRKYPADRRTPFAGTGPSSGPPSTAGEPINVSAPAPTASRPPRSAAPGGWRSPRRDQRSGGTARRGPAGSRSPAGGHDPGRPPPHTRSARLLGCRPLGGDRGDVRTSVKLPSSQAASCRRHSCEAAVPRAWADRGPGGRRERNRQAAHPDLSRPQEASSHLGRRTTPTC